MPQTREFWIAGRYVDDGRITPEGNDSHDALSFDVWLTREGISLSQLTVASNRPGDREHHTDSVSGIMRLCVLVSTGPVIPHRAVTPPPLKPPAHKPYAILSCAHRKVAP